MSIDDIIKDFKYKYSKLWWDTEKDFPQFGNKIGLKEKLLKERRMNKFINTLFYHLKKCPEDKIEQDIWRDQLWEMIKEFGYEIGFNTDEINGEFSKELPGVTNEFIRKVKTFNPEIKLEHIVQALRNVWIMNIIQVIFGLKVEHTLSVFAYSMLYPYTDNYLDSTSISIDEKKRINKDFRKRIEGIEVVAVTKYEIELFTLISMIEGQYPREYNKEVYESLLSIHRAQEQSLIQQNGKVSPYERDILGISVEKGGTSVLADAYLVSGKLKEEEADFTFGYGALLQFCDDLQDAKEDLKNGHMTIFSQTAKKWHLDNITNSLFDYSIKVVDNADCFISSEAIKMKEFLKKNIIFLIFEAISQNKNLYSRKYIRTIKDYYPFRISYTRNLYKKIKKNYSSFKNLCGFSIDEVILMATENSHDKINQ